jgi:GT2 family glycosyltransferase
MLTYNSIQLSIEAFNLPIMKNVDFIHGDAIELNQKTGEPWLWRSLLESPTLETMLKKNTIHSASLMYRRSVFERIGLFDETLNTAEEYEFNLRCLKAGMQIGYVNAPLAVYRRHPAQKVRMVSVSAKSQEREMVRNKYR